MESCWVERLNFYHMWTIFLYNVQYFPLRISLCMNYITPSHPLSKLFLRFHFLACDWSEHNQHSRNIFVVHGRARLCCSSAMSAYMYNTNQPKKLSTLTTKHWTLYMKDSDCPFDQKWPVTLTFKLRFSPDRRLNHPEIHGLIKRVCLNLTCYLCLHVGFHSVLSSYRSWTVLSYWK